jgi:small subunit ribosomal protein S4
MQLREKQKVKRIYGVLERQFKKYYEMASRSKEATGEALLKILETRLDNIIYRLNLAYTRQQARQFVSHGHVQVNGKKVTISSYNAKIGDIVSLSAKAANFDFIKKLTEEKKDLKLSSWLSKKATVGKIMAMPKREDIDAEIDERLIVEFYSR